MSHYQRSEKFCNSTMASDRAISFHRLTPRSTNVGLLQKLFRLRYDIYCLEKRFLSAEEFPEKLETDSFDAVSTHIAACTSNNEIVGSLRLVQPNTKQNFPFEQTCALFHSVTLPPPQESGEISRFIVNKTYRQNKTNFLQASEPVVQLDAIGEPLVKNVITSAELVLGMYRELYRHSCVTGIRYWYAAMERSLATLLRRTGFNFEPIGPVTDYYGPVIPFLVDLNILRKTLEAQNPVLWDWFNDTTVEIKNVADPFFPDLHFSSVGTPRSVISSVQ